MARFVEGEDRAQQSLLPARLEDYVAEDNPVRVVDAFVDVLDLGRLAPDFKTIANFRKDNGSSRRCASLTRRCARRLIGRSR